MSLIGKTLLYRYESGVEIVGRFESEGVLAWEALSGPAAGQSGVEQIFAAEVAPGIHHVAWLEQNSGTSISQVLDLNANAVTAFISWSVPEGRQAHFGRGALIPR